MKQIACKKCKRVRWARTMQVSSYERDCVPRDDRPPKAREPLCLNCRPKFVKEVGFGFSRKDVKSRTHYKKGKGKSKGKDKR